MKCPECKNKIEKGGKYCPRCGLEVQSVKEKPGKIKSFVQGFIDDPITKCIDMALWIFFASIGIAILVSGLKCTFKEVLAPAFEGIGG